MLSLLEAAAEGRERSQRSMAQEFGIAVGLVNTYVKICIKKGFVKVRRTPSRRYVYLLTPKGAAEKLRLTLFLLSRELEKLRRARADYSLVFREARRRGWERIVLLGGSDLADIAALGALEHGVSIVASVDRYRRSQCIVGAPVLERLSDVHMPFDGILITDLANPHLAFEAAVAAVGEGAVLAPQLFQLPRFSWGAGA